MSRVEQLKHQRRKRMIRSKRASEIERFIALSLCAVYIVACMLAIPAIIIGVSGSAAAALILAADQHENRYNHQRQHYSDL